MIPNNLDYSVSARGKSDRLAVMPFIAMCFPGIPIKSIFGFREYTPLYGGRIFRGPELSEADIGWMYDHGIAYRIPLQNIVATRADYEESKPFLRKYHRKGNSVITVRHELARWIREDFPLFEIEASVINQVRSLDKLPQFLDTFDVVVLHPSLNDYSDQLATIEDKSRIRLFVNAGCMYKCPTMECYGSISRLNKHVADTKFKCAQDHDKDYAIDRANQVGMTEFNVHEFIRLGFTKFKKMRNKGNTAF
jgi:hypothetical protein